MVNNNETLDEENESNNKQKKISDTDFKKYILEYVENSTKGNLEYFKENKKNFKQQFDDFCLYLRLAGKQDDILKIKNRFNESNFEIFFNNVINTEILPIYEMLSNLEKISFKSYKLDNNQIEKLKKSFNSKDKLFLYGLFRSENKRDKYLINENILSKEKLEEVKDGISKDNEQILKEIFNKDSSLINEVENRKDLQLSIFNLYNMNLPVHFSDVEIILKGFNNDEGKIALIKYFLPTISLENAKKSKLISESDVYSELSKIANKYGLTDIAKDEFIKGQNLKKIFIETEKFLTKNNILSMLNNESFESIADEINEAKNDIDTVEILGKKDFMEFCKNSQDLSNELKDDIKNKFEVGNYINIESKDKNGKIVNNYFYIESIGNVSVSLKNVTKRNGISSTNEGKTDIKSFQELFNLFEKASKDQSKGISINAKKSVNNKIYLDDKEINEIPENNDVDTLDKLKITLDELDPKGAGIKIKDMAFKFKKGANDNSPFDENFFYVVPGPKDSIKLNSGQVFTGANLSNFLEAFEVNKCTRFERIDTAEKFVEKFAEKNDKFKDIIFDDKKFVPKDQKGKKDFPGINLLVGDNESIQIDKVEDNLISFSTGEYKEGDKKKNEANTFKNDKIAKNWSYTEFFMYIKNKKLEPKKEEVEEKVEDSHGEHMHRHKSLLTGWMGWLSITEVIQGGKSVIHAIEHSLETGNKLKAAQAALAFGKFLPYHLYVELQSEVESQEKETMEKIKKGLTDVDSKVMFPMIVHILENKSSPQYEIEAAMLATLKYGTLYPKDLAKFRGSYVWFEALGGNKSLISKYTKMAKESDPDLVITEEVLIMFLLSDQANGDIKPKRRSKIHKEFAQTIQEGLSKESGDGERETGNKMTVDGRISYIMGEFKGSTYANGIGGLENVWAKGPDPAWKMNTIPFVIMASGLSLELNQSLINKLKKFGYTTPYNSLAFCSSKEGVNKYNDYLDKVIELYKGEDSPIYKDFQKTKKASGGKNRALLVKEFWDKYGKELYPVINMNDGFVISRMDIPGNENLKYYHDKVSGILNSSDFDPKDSDIGNEYYSADNSPVAQTGALLYKIEPKDKGYLSGVAKEVINSHMDYIINVLNNPNVGEDGKKKIFKESYKKFERYLYTDKMDAHRPQNLPKLSGKRYDGFNVYNEMKKKGFDFYDDKNQYPDNKDEVKKFEDGPYNAFLEEQRNKFKNKTHIQDTDDEVSLVKDTIDDILEKPATNDDEHKQVA